MISTLQLHYGYFNLLFTLRCLVFLVTHKFEWRIHSTNCHAIQNSNKKGSKLSSMEKYRAQLCLQSGMKRFILMNINTVYFIFVWFIIHEHWILVAVISYLHHNQMIICFENIWIHLIQLICCPNDFIS